GWERADVLEHFDGPQRPSCQYAVGDFLVCGRKSCRIRAAEGYARACIHFGAFACAIFVVECLLCSGSMAWSRTASGKCSMRRSSPALTSTACCTMFSS